MLNGGDAADSLSGDEGNDTLFGGKGDDVVVGVLVTICCWAIAVPIVFVAAMGTILFSEKVRSPLTVNQIPYGRGLLKIVLDTAHPYKYYLISSLTLNWDCYLSIITQTIGKNEFKSLLIG